MLAVLLSVRRVLNDAPTRDVFRCPRGRSPFQRSGLPHGAGEIEGVSVGDLADACLAVLAGRDPALQVWTYDREFRTTWRRPDGTRIPLAV